MASEGRKRTVAVIGAGVVGVTAASFLLRKGHGVILLDPGNPGEGASFGNAGCFNGSSVVPMSMPDTIRKVPGWLIDPLGPLVVRWHYLPVLAPWLVRFIRAGTKEKVERQARALRTLVDQGIETMARRMFPALRDEVPDQNITTWMGHRPSVPDSLPVIGPSRRTPDVVYAFGHGHIGMTCAAKTGKTVAELISGEPPHVDVGPFSPRRFDEALRPRRDKRWFGALGRNGPSSVGRRRIEKMRSAIHS